MRHGKSNRTIAIKRWHLIPLILFLLLVLTALAFGIAAFHARQQTAAPGPVMLPEAEVTVSENIPNFSESLAVKAPESIPAFNGNDFCILNGNIPEFTDYDLDMFYGESYTELDELGRCGAAAARLHKSMMPTEARGEIGMIRPSGWHTVTYPEQIPDRYLYNRCHLIAYALSGQNANELNLITGTRYLNVSTMLGFEKQVMDYLDHSDNHVLYRVTPLFIGEELVARGVEMEAMSVEDRGEGVCFHVFLYNYQPGIIIDYLTGNSEPA